MYSISTLVLQRERSRCVSLLFESGKHPIICTENYSRAELTRILKISLTSKQATQLEPRLELGRWFAQLELARANEKDRNPP